MLTNYHIINLNRPIEETQKLAHLVTRQKEAESSQWPKVKASISLNSVVKSYSHDIYLSLIHLWFSYLSFYRFV